MLLRNSFRQQPAFTLFIPVPDPDKLQRSFIASHAETAPWEKANFNIGEDRHDQLRLVLRPGRQLQGEVATPGEMQGAGPYMADSSFGL